MAEHMQMNFHEEPDKTVMFSKLDTSVQEEFLEMRNVIFQGNIISLRELLTPLKTADIDEIIDADLLSKLTNGENLTVGHEIGPLNESVKHRYIERKFERYCTIFSEQEMCKLDINDKHYITALWGSTGSGKSTVLQNLAVKMKESHPYLWVVRFDLNNYLKTLSDLKENKRKNVNVMDLLNSRPESQIKSYLEKKIFSLSDKVVLMIDGVDEVCSSYKDMVLGIIKDIKKRCNFVKIFMTSSAKIDKAVEKELWMRNTLEPFSKKEQVDLLSKFWKHNLNVHEDDNEKCKIYAEKVVREKWIDEHEGVPIGVALQIQMVAEILEKRDSFSDKALCEWEGCYEFLTSSNSEPCLPKKLSLVHLYQVFIHKNCSNEKNRLCENLRSDIAKINQKYDFFFYIIALETILNKEQCHLFTCYQNRREVIPEELQCPGILKKADNVEFTHRTFAEYFLAECISIEVPKSQNTKFLTFLGEEVLSRREFQVVRVFLENFIEAYWTSLPDKTLEVIGYALKQSGSCIIETLAKEGSTHILKFILNCFELAGTFPDVDCILVDGETVLHTAIKEGHPDIVECLIDKGLSVDLRDKDDRSILHVAAAKGYLSLVKFLVEHGAKVNCKDNEGRTPLHEAAASGSLDTVKYLLEYGAAVNSRDGEGRMALHEAAKIGDLDNVKYLVENGADVNSKARLGSAFFDAAKGGHLVVMKYLVEKGANVMFRSESGGTVLHNCLDRDPSDEKNEILTSDAVEIFKFLKDRGVDINSVDKESNTVLHCSINENDRVQLIEFLVENGADTTRMNNECDAALDVAIRKGAINTVKYLIDKDAPTFRHDENLIRAVIDKHSKVVEYLLGRGANVKVKDQQDYSMLHRAVFNNDLEMVKVLIEAGIDEPTILEDCTTLCDIEIVKFLVEHGVDSGGMFQRACKNGDLNLVKFLVERGERIDDIDDIGRNSELFHYLLDKGFTFDEQKLLYNAIGDLNIVKYLVGRGVDVNSRAYRTPLIQAAVFGHLHTVKYLVKHGARINDTDKFDCTALYEAVSEKYTEIVEFLVENGADVNVVTDENISPLYRAIEENDLDMVKILVEHGAEMRLDDSEHSALRATLVCDDIDIVEYILGTGSNENFVNVVERLLIPVEGKEESPLINHMLEYDNPVVNELLQRGMRLDARLINKYQLLFYATKKNDLELVKCLMDNDADVNIRNEKGYTPLHVTHDLGVTKFLIRKDADVNAAANDGTTVLHHAIKYKNLNVFKFLVISGADVNREDEQGRTPLEVAATMGSYDKSTYLIENGAKVRLAVLKEAAKSGDLDLVKFLVQYVKPDCDVMFSAVQRGDLDLVKFLIESGGIDIRDEDYATAIGQAEAVGDLDVVEYLIQYRSTQNKNKIEHCALHIAARKLDFETFKYLVQQGVDVTSVDDQGRTVLHEAAKKGGIYVLKLALENGAGAVINVKDANGRSALQEASHDGDLRVLKFLVENGADVDWTALYESVMRRDAPMTKFLVESGAKVNGRTGKGRTALHEAAANGSLDIVEMLVEHGADVKARDAEGRTALHEAAGKGEFRDAPAHLAIMQLLMENGAEANARAEDGRTPLHDAAATCDVRKIQLLVGKGADPDARTQNGDAPISFILGSREKARHCRETDIDIVRYLVENGARLDVRNKDGRTLLHEACLWDDLEVVEYLVAEGLDLQSKTVEGRTLVHEAAKHGSLGTLQYLIQSGLEVNATTTNGWTPLHEAAQGFSLRILESLVNNGADVNAKNDDGRTALHEAAVDNSLDLVEFLVTAGADVNIEDKDGHTALFCADDNYCAEVADYLRTVSE